jgi:hypothetical protein
MMKLILIIVPAVLLCLWGCAALLDGKFVTKPGKETPFKPMINPYEAPKDPTGRE